MRDTQNPLKGNQKIVDEMDTGFDGGELVKPLKIEDRDSMAALIATKRFGLEDNVFITYSPNK